MLKIYGIDSVFFMKIREWLVIRDEESTVPEKQEILRIELNLADSAGLTSLRGIGPAFARRIIQFRNMLGGFYSVMQLQEVYGMTEDRFRQMSASVNADPSLITFISLNFADYSTLSRHPYISGAQARKIIEWRSANGPFHRKEILLEAGILDDLTFHKIEPYLKCE
jgi:DNA uptake protein ComE-like DNA-binding protein